MVRGIVAIDSKRGMAGEHGLPWKLPREATYFVDTIQNGRVLMGYGTYKEVPKPFGSQPNFVATRRHNDLREGFVAVDDARKFLIESSEDVWNIGGPRLLLETIDLLDEFYITQIFRDFDAIKFLPPFEDKFELASESPRQIENGIEYVFQIWKRANFLEA